MTDQTKQLTSRTRQPQPRRVLTPAPTATEERPAPDPAHYAFRRAMERTHSRIRATEARAEAAEATLHYALGLIGDTVGMAAPGAGPGNLMDWLSQAILRIQEPRTHVLTNALAEKPLHWIAEHCQDYQEDFWAQYARGVEAEMETFSRAVAAHLGAVHWDPANQTLSEWWELAIGRAVEGGE